MRLLVPALAALLCTSPALGAPKVIASVVPVHGIVAAVMGELGQPELLLQGSMSEHRASFTTAQIVALGKADLIFIIGHGLETKLAQLSGSEAVNGKTFIELSDAPGVITHPVRQGGAWEPDDDDHKAETAGETSEGILGFDPHVWLDPENAKAMAGLVAIELTKADPEHAQAYTANATAFAASVDLTAAGIAAELAPLKHRPFIVFHDAYQYFEKRFGLTAVGSISDVSAHAPSAQRLEDIRRKLSSTGAVCVFREPQFDSKLVDAVIEGTQARDGVLDPLGASLTPGPQAYRQLLTNLAASLKACLAA